MRLLVVVEASTALLGAIYARAALLRELIGNGWIQLVSVDPGTGAMAIFTVNGFQPWAPRTAALPTVASSMDWYRGKTDFVPPALIALPAAAPRFLQEASQHVA
jgi:hypothetical protein